MCGVHKPGTLQRSLCTNLLLAFIAYVYINMSNVPAHSQMQHKPQYQLSCVQDVHVYLCMSMN